MASSQTITSSQLKRAQEAQFHRNGKPLQTTEAIREWVESAGLLPVYPLPQFQAPMPSFAEAVLGRTENDWVPPSRRSTAAQTDVDEEANEPEEDYAADDDQDSIEEDDESFDDDDESEDEDADSEEFEEENDVTNDEDLEPATAQGDEAMLSGDGNIPADRETMLSDEEEFAEDEGDEIAEQDRIDAEGDPLPNDLREGETATEAPEEDAPLPAVNGFSAEERETVHRALARLIEDGTLVPLNLLGNATGEPDYVVSASAFSFVYTLRGDKNWKNEPATTGAMRVSPLAVKVFTLLKEKGAMAPHQLTGLLGQGITDSATLRALNELWAIQRIVPLPNADGKPAKWELTTGKFLRAMKAGANAGQPTALSALLSLYLNQAIATTEDDMEIFLSPLAARSRVREVVHGLSATRQLESLVVDGKTLLHITGGLPEMPEDDAAPVAVASPQRSRYEQDDRRAAITEGRERPQGQARFGEGERRPREDRGEGASYPRRPRSTGSRPPFSDRSRGDRPAFGSRKPFGDRKPFAPREGGERRPFTPREGGDRERRPFQRREGSGEPRPFVPRERGSYPPRDRGNFPPRNNREGFAPRERNSFARPWEDDRPRRSEGDGERRPFTPREDRGERHPFAPREGGERKPYAPRPNRGGFAPRGDRPFTPREGGERRPFTPRGDGERRPFTPRGDRGGFAPRGDRPFTPREGGERRPFAPRGDGERRPFTPRENRGGFAPRGERPFTPREGGERRPFTPRGDGERRPFSPREGGFNRGGDRPSFGSGNRPAFGGRPRFDREGGSGRPGGFGGRDRERFSGEPGEGRPSFQSGAHSAGPGGSKFGGSGFGRDRGGKGAPGKFGRPGFKPSFKGPGSGPARGGAPKRRPE